MKSVDYNAIVSLQEHWKENYPLPDGLFFIELSKTLMHRAINNGNELSGVTLRCPEDCGSIFILRDFAKMIDYLVTPVKDNDGWHVTF